MYDNTKTIVKAKTKHVLQKYSQTQGIFKIVNLRSLHNC
jgi:hypothetical protein